jgi:hypothetical protein
MITGKLSPDIAKLTNLVFLTVGNNDFEPSTLQEGISELTKLSE